MTSSTETLQNLLKQNGFSITRQRLVVFNALVEQEPITINELLKKTSKQLDKVSVYRIIDTFEKIGVVQRLNIGWKYKIELTDKFADHHHHLVCLKCGKIIPINEHALENFIEDIANQNKFQPKDHQVEIQGYCKQCQAASVVKC